MNKFKIGDLVTGKNSECYALTNDAAVCRVFEIKDDECMRVKLVRFLKETRGNKGYSFEHDPDFGVRQKDFVLYSTKRKQIVILRRKHAPNENASF